MNFSDFSTFLPNNWGVEPIWLEVGTGAGIVVATYISLIIGKWLLRWANQKFLRGQIQGFLREIITQISSFPLMVLSLYVGWNSIGPVDNIGFNIFRVFVLLLIVMEIKKASKSLIEALVSVGNKHHSQLFNPTTKSALMLSVNLVLYSGFALIALSSLGINITALLASLGIGGIAIAFAAQGVLGDLFASISIYFDRPFNVGDFIVFGDKSGVAKEIGLRTTRLDTLQGEELVVPNKELADSQIQNFQKMHQRRVVMSLGVEYGTSVEKLKEGLKLLKESVTKEKEAEFARVHFCEFAESSMNYELVYYVKSGDYGRYMDIRESINFNIAERFEKAGLSMAFPSRTRYIQNQT